MANEYEFQQLPDEESIRVLILAPGKDEEPLSGVLKVIHLSNRHQTLRSTQRAQEQLTNSSAPGVSRWTPDIPYEAISYVWGSDEENHIILLSGNTHRITANLSDALRQCRRPDQARALWADSICIDQNKLKEKNHQVYMMGRIYASSQRTLICLGIDPDNRDHARDAFGMISDVNLMIQETYRSPGFSWAVDSFPRPLPDDALVNDSRWRSIGVLASNPWFSRGWVVQEAALGREARLLWTGFETTLQDLIRTDSWYSLRARFQMGNLNRRWFLPVLFLSAIHQQQSQEFRVYFASEISLAKPGILYALHCARELGLSNPRDRIYAFMALPFVWNPVPALRPDYNQSHLEVYRDFAVRYLELTSDLDLLCYLTYDERDTEPLGAMFESSWVPRWDRKAWMVNPTLGQSGPRKFGQTSAEAAGFVIVQGESRARASLQVRAVIFDSIRLVSPELRKSMTVEDLITIWSHGSKQAGSATACRLDEFGYACDSLMFLEALSRGKWSGSTNYEEWTASLKSYSEFLQNSTTDPGFPGNSHASPAIQFCHQHLVEFSNRLHVYLLERGYYGLGAPVIRPKDVCAFVFGVSMPLILRKVPQAGPHHYRVVGPTFVSSKRLDGLGDPRGLYQRNEWESWDGLCQSEGWTDWGLKEEEIILI